MITVATQGTEKKEINYVKGLTVAEVLNLAEIEPKKDATITIDGKAVELKTSVQDRALIVIMPKVANG